MKRDVHLLDGGRTDFADDEFDRVVIVDFLEHIEDDAGFIAELHRILKPGGVLIVNTDNFKDNDLRKAQMTENPLEDHSLDGYRLFPVEMTKLLPPRRAMPA